MMGDVGNCVRGWTRMTRARGPLLLFPTCDVWGSGGFKLDVTKTNYGKIVWRRPLSYNYVLACVLTRISIVSASCTRLNTTFYIACVFF